MIVLTFFLKENRKNKRHDNANKYECRNLMMQYYAIATHKNRDIIHQHIHTSNTQLMPFSLTFDTYKTTHTALSYKVITKNFATN